MSCLVMIFRQKSKTKPQIAKRNVQMRRWNVKLLGKCSEVCYISVKL